mmetsp:Transcript_12592/g.37862  ORF Transcript_12592/g.37862 Transcript_12592/m.37862 type:complete len:344 (+) Transcript_12592:2856-3887(+)
MRRYAMLPLRCRLPRVRPLCSDDAGGGVAPVAPTPPPSRLSLTADAMPAICCAVSASFRRVRHILAMSSSSSRKRSSSSRMVVARASSLWCRVFTFLTFSRCVVETSRVRASMAVLVWSSSSRARRARVEHTSPRATSSTTSSNGSGATSLRLAWPSSSASSRRADPAWARRSRSRAAPPMARCSMSENAADSGLCSCPSLITITWVAMMMRRTCSMDTSITLSRTMILPVSDVSRFGSTSRMSRMGSRSLNRCTRARLSAWNIVDLPNSSMIVYADRLPRDLSCRAEYLEDEGARNDANGDGTCAGSPRADRGESLGLQGTEAAPSLPCSSPSVSLCSKYCP